MHHDLIEGDLNAVLIAHQLHFPVQGTVAQEEVFLCHIRNNTQHNTGFTQGFHAHISGASKEQLAVFGMEFGKCCSNNLLHLPDIGVIGDRQIAHSNRSISGTILHITDIRVVYNLLVSAGILNAGGTDTDFLYGTPETVQNNDVTP